MTECPICIQYTDRPAEIIAHQVLAWIAEKEEFWRLVHVTPNSTRDTKGKDFFIVPEKGSRFCLPLQIKSIRILESKKLKIKLERMRKEPDKNKPQRIKRNWEERFKNPAKLKKYLRQVIADYAKLDLIVNDQEIKKGFESATRRLNLEQILNEEAGGQEIYQVYGEIEYFIDAFAKAIRHAELHPSVKVLLFVDTSEDSDLEKQIPGLKEIWLPLIKKAVNLEKGPK